MVNVDSGSRTPSSGYVVSLVSAVAGLFFITLTLVGAVLARAGRDSVAATGWPGQTAFAGSFLILFASRLVFWNRSPPALQQFVRSALTILLCGALGLAAVALVLASGVVAGERSPRVHPVFLIGVAGLAALCQVGTIVWLLKFRRE